MHDGNYVVASRHRRPWQKQLTMLAGYLYFYNPVWLVVALIRSKTPVAKKPAYLQIFGMMGLVMTIVRTSGWAMRLMFGRIERLSAARQRDPHAGHRRSTGTRRGGGTADRRSACAGSLSDATTRDRYPLISVGGCAQHTGSTSQSTFAADRRGSRASDPFAGWSSLGRSVLYVLHQRWRRRAAAARLPGPRR